MEIHVGTSGYGYKEWKGAFYPEKITPKEMLRFYSARLGVVEINNTFYHMPTPGVLKSWAEQVPDDFVFAFKAPRLFSHVKRLKDVNEEAAYLFKTLAVLGRKLGPVLFQFPKSFRAQPEVLEKLLRMVPDGVSCAFEFRSASRLDSEIQDILRTSAASLCTADTDDDPANAIISTAPWGYLRLRRSDYSDEDLAQWKSRIIAQKWTRAFVFFKHEEKAKGAAMAMRFDEMVRSVENTAGPYR